MTFDPNLAIYNQTAETSTWKGTMWYNRSKTYPVIGLSWEGDCVTPVLYYITRNAYEFMSNPRYVDLLCCFCKEGRNYRKVADYGPDKVMCLSCCTKISSVISHCEGGAVDCLGKRWVFPNGNVSKFCKNCVKMR